MNLFQDHGRCAQGHSAATVFLWYQCAQVARIGQGFDKVRGVGLRFFQLSPVKTRKVSAQARTLSRMSG
jgi:hypothetical protein